MPIFKLSLPAGSHAVTLTDSGTLLVDVPVESAAESYPPPAPAVQNAQTQTEQAVVSETEQCDEYALVRKEFMDLVGSLDASFAISTFMVVVTFPFTAVANHMVFNLTTIGLRTYLGIVASHTASVVHACVIVLAIRAAALTLRESSLQPSLTPIPLTEYKQRLKRSRKRARLCSNLQIFGTLISFPGVVLTVRQIFSSLAFETPFYVFGGAYGLWIGTTGMFGIVFPGGYDPRLSRGSLLSLRSRFVGELEES